MRRKPIGGSILLLLVALVCVEQISIISPTKQNRDVTVLRILQGPLKYGGRWPRGGPKGATGDPI